MKANALTKKTFREELNRDCSGTTNHRHGKFAQRTRPYGDYLYAQDREKFNVDYAEWIQSKLSK